MISQRLLVGIADADDYGITWTVKSFKADGSWRRTKPMLCKQALIAKICVMSAST